MEQPQVDVGAFFQLVKVALGGVGVPVGLPAAAAGEVPALVADEADDVGQGVTQEHPDLVGEAVPAQPVGQLVQQGLAAGGAAGCWVEGVVVILFFVYGLCLL